MVFTPHPTQATVKSRREFWLKEDALFYGQFLSLWWGHTLCFLGQSGDYVINIKTARNKELYSMKLSTETRGKFRP